MSLTRARRHRLDRVRRRCCSSTPIVRGARTTSTGCSSRRSRRRASMFVAVQRITTARWSRPIMRLLEGYVAFLPVAFVLLLVSLFIGKGHIFPWTHERPPVAEKVMWYNAVFLSTRAIVSFGVITLLSLWYIYTSVRLDVGLAAGGGLEVGRRSPRAHARRLRRGAPRAAQHALAAGEARRLPRAVLRLRLVAARLRPVDGAARCTSRARCTAGGSSWARGSARSRSSRSS